MGLNRFNGANLTLNSEAGNRTCDPWFTRHSTYPLHHGGFLVVVYLIIVFVLSVYCLWPCSLAEPVLARWVYGICCSLSRNSPKAQPAVILVLKRLRRRVNGLKSHPTDWQYTTACNRNVGSLTIFKVYIVKLIKIFELHISVK